MKEAEKDLGPGVPEALPQVVQRLVHQVQPETLDRIWLFPPMIRGRKETGLVAASCFAPSDEDSTRRRLLTCSYTAERTGKGLAIESLLEVEGEAPADRLPRVMHGVVVRSGMPLGEADELEVAGDSAVLDRWFAEEVDPDHLDPALPPLAVQEEMKMADDSADESAGDLHPAPPLVADD